MTHEESGSHAAATTQESVTSHASLHPRLAWILCYNETGSVREVCRRFSISRKTFYKWIKRYRDADGDCSCLTDMSRRPHHSPKTTPPDYVAALRRARMETGYGQRRLKVYLQENYNINISERTIWKILKRIEATVGQTSQEYAVSSDCADDLVAEPGS